MYPNMTCKRYPINNKYVIISGDMELVGCWYRQTICTKAIYLWNK